MPPRIRIVEEHVGDVIILRLNGRLELEQGDLAFRDYINNLVADGRANILLDLKDVTRIDSAGIGMMVSKYLTARRSGGTIKLLHLTKHSDHLINITRLATVFEVFEDEAEAVRSFQGSGVRNQDSGLL